MAQNIKQTSWLLGVATLALMFLTPAFATPVCGTASLSTYDASNYACTLGIYTLDDFTFTATGTAPLLSDSQIVVDPTGSTSTTISVQFSAPPDGFTAGPNQTAQYVIQYNLDPLFPMIPGGIIDLGPNDPVTLTGEFCGNGTLASAPNTNPTVYPTCQGTDPNGVFSRKTQLTGNGAPGSSFFDFPHNPIVVSTVDIRLILDLNGPASADSFGSVIYTTGGGPTPTPEPSTAFLLAPALLGLVWMRKKFQAGAR